MPKPTPKMKKGVSAVRTPGSKLVVRSGRVSPGKVIKEGGVTETVIGRNVRMNRTLFGSSSNVDSSSNGLDTKGVVLPIVDSNNSPLGDHHTLVMVNHISDLCDENKVRVQCSSWDNSYYQIKYGQHIIHQFDDQFLTVWHTNVEGDIPHIYARFGPVNPFASDLDKKYCRSSAIMKVRTEATRWTSNPNMFDKLRILAPVDMWAELNVALMNYEK